MNASIVPYRAHRFWRWAIVTDEGIAGFLTRWYAIRWATRQGYTVLEP